jgi:UDP-N-acetylmuramoyl-L-alanyl-D-glutamate--2,6-diaminopimelate ligase
VDYRNRGWESVKIKHLIKSLVPLKQFSGRDDFEVRGISCHSRLTKKNYIFVAIKGNRDDGNRFIEEAIEKGARAIISEAKAGRFKGIPFIKVKDARRALAELAARFYRHPSSKIKVIGVTGTNGKTTVTYLLEALLKISGFHPSVIGTINYRFKNKIFPSKNTTPGPLEIQPLLARMPEEGVDHCVIEVSSHALHQERVRGVSFHSAIFTNLTQDHLDYHKTRKNYFESKGRLFKNLSPDSFAVINNDDSYGRKLKKLTRATIITYGFNKGAQVRAKNIELDGLRTAFTLVTPQQEARLVTWLIGRHNIYNVLACVAWAIESGISLSTIKRALKDFRLVPGRLERIKTNKGFSIFVDYAHTPDALKNVLASLRSLSRKRIILVFGCGGDRDKNKRPKMGQVATQLSDYCFITSDNPRSESPKKIIEDIKRGIRQSNFCIIVDRAKAIKKALKMARPQDVVLVAGKGHENYQVIKNKIIRFDDKEVIKKCLKSWSY